MASFVDILPLFLCENIIYLVLQWVYSFWIYSVRNCNNFTVYTVNCPIFVREVYTFVYYNVVQFRHYLKHKLSIYALRVPEKMEGIAIFFKVNKYFWCLK